MTAARTDVTPAVQGLNDLIRDVLSPEIQREIRPGRPALVSAGPAQEVLHNFTAERHRVIGWGYEFSHFSTNCDRRPTALVEADRRSCDANRFRA